ncbi:MAG: hypothetical protein KAR42_16660 [candidate division Zixibacteria bacterium]|nr:hypothetical protein [candidate division Zixibacteria bacterium]
MRKTISILLICICAMTQLIVADEAHEEKTYPYIKPIFSERFRLVTWDNAISLDDRANAERFFTRHRTSLGGQLCLNKNFDFTIKLTNEFRYYVEPDEKINSGFHEVFVDHLNLRYRFGSKLPLILTIGRQNIILGEGFVVMDGHPLDGSRSIYFNAIRLDVKFSKSTSGTFFYSTQTERDEALPLIRDRKQSLVEQPEQGGGVYLKTKLQKTDIHLYYIYKKLEPTKYHNWLYGFSSDINTIGARTNYSISEKLSVTGEGAYQFGSYRNHSDRKDRSAFAGYLYFNYSSSKDSHPFTISPGMYYYSGDKPQTDKIEGWEPLFSRWPKWSESYIYTQINESTVAYWSNIYSFFVKSKIQLLPKVDLLFDFHRMYAPRFPIVITGLIGNDITPPDNTMRGNLYIFKLNFRLNKHWSGHLLWEEFAPGQFHHKMKSLASVSDVIADGYSWVRAEILFKL